MASKKTSALTSATTPLAGTEELYLVQSSNSRKTTTGQFYTVGGTDVPVTDGGTGASTAQAALDNFFTGATFVEADKARLADATDNTKLVDFNVAGVTTGTTRTVTWGDADVTFGAYAPTILNTANEAGFKAAVNLEIGTDVQAFGAVLDDLNALGAAATDGEFIVATGAGAFAYESGATARASLGLAIGTDVQAWDADLDTLAGNGLGTAGLAILADSTATDVRDYLGAWQVVDASGVQVAHTGDTNETVLATVTIPAGAMGANGILRVELYYTYTNNANTKTLRLRLGGTGGTIFKGLSLTTTAGTRHMVTIANRNSESSQVGAPSGLGTSFTLSAGSAVTGAIDTSSSQDLVFTGQLADSADSINLEYYTVELFHQA